MAVIQEFIPESPRGTRDGLRTNNPLVPPGATFMESDSGRRKTNKSKTSAVNWNDLGYEDPTFRISEFNSLVDAIYFLIAESPSLGNTKVRPTLIIDKDTTLPAGANYVIDFKVVVQDGCLIKGSPVSRTMDGKNPISGTVPTLYAQLTFRGMFIAERDQHVFSDDILVWFAGNAVDKIWVEWWGLKKGTATDIEQSSNVRAFQYASICAVESRTSVPDASTKQVSVGSGTIRLNSPVVLMKCGVNGHPFLTGKRQNSSARDTKIILRGASPIKHEVNFDEVTNIIYTATYAGPFMVQAGRDVVIENFRVEGVNDVSSKDHLNPSPHGGLFEVLWNLIKRRDYFQSGDVSQLDWISNNIKWNRFSPYAAIITDPFRLAIPKNTAGNKYVASIANTDYIRLKKSGVTDYVVNEADQYLDKDGNVLDADGKDVGGVDRRVGIDGKIASAFIDTPVQLYYGRNDHQNGWQAVFGGMHIRKFVSGICQTLTGQQGDTYTYHNLQFQMIPFGISTCQDQSRDCTANKILAYGSQGGVHSIFENSFHGAGTGVTPKILDVHTAGGCKYIVYGTDAGRGSVGISNIYAESIYDYVAGSGALNYPAHITSCDLKRDTVRTYTHPTHGTGFLPRNSNLSGTTVTNSMIGAYVEKPLENKWAYMLFDNCTFNGCTTGPTLNYLPADKGWFEYIPRDTNVFIGKNSTSPSLSNIIWFPTKGISSYECIDGTESVKLTIPNPEDLAEVDIYDICRLTTNILMPFNAAIVFEKGTDYVKVGGFRSDEYLALKTHLSTYVGNPSLLLLVENQSHSEFYGTRNINNSKLIDVTYAVGYGNLLSTSRLKDTTVTTVGSTGLTYHHDSRVLRMPNGLYYRVQSHSSTQITLRKSYTDSFTDHVFTDPSPKPLVENWVSGVYAGTTHEAAKYYTKGKTYPKVVSRFNSDVIGSMKCTKSGGFNKTTDNLTYTATFLEYDINEKLVAYVTSASRTLINHSGTTVQRPNAAIIPLPIGFIYKNTTTSAHETWSGVEWVSSAPTTPQFQVVTETEWNALTQTQRDSANYIVVADA